MVISERETSGRFFRPRPETPTLTLELANTLKPLAQAMPDQTPLEFVYRLARRSVVMTVKNRQAIYQRLGEEEIVEAVRAWEQAVLQLNGVQKANITAALGDTMYATTFTYEENIPPTVGHLRRAPLEQLNAVGVSPLRIAFMKEVFGNENFEPGEYASASPASESLESPS